MATLVWPAINLAVLVGIIGYLTRKPLKQFMKERRENVGAELIRVRELLQSARAKYDEFTAKLKAVDAEVTSLKAQIQSDATASKDRIVSSARSSSGAIVSDAKANADSVFKDLKNDLRAELGGRVIDRAEAILVDRLTGDDRARIRQEFSTEVEQIR